MFEISEIQKERIKILGREFTVDRPSVGQVVEFQKQKKDDSNPVESFEAMCKWISQLGIDEETLRSLKVNQLTQLVEYLTDSKKN